MYNVYIYIYVICLHMFTLFSWPGKGAKRLSIPSLAWGWARCRWREHGWSDFTPEAGLNYEAGVFLKSCDFFCSWFCLRNRVQEFTLWQSPDTSRHCCWHSCWICCNLLQSVLQNCNLLHVVSEERSEKCNSGGQYAALQAAVHGGVVYIGQGAGREPVGSPWCKTHRSEVENIVIV